MTLIIGKAVHDHQVLTVGSLPDQTRDVGPVLDRMGIKFLHFKTGEQGLKAIKNESRPFSLVICDQRLKDMKGTDFLAQVKEISPDTIRFLITGYSDMDTIILAVNKGAVHQYISIPWNEDQMTESVRSGITRYEYHLESDQLFALAKTQNGKLFELNCELMETTKFHDDESKALEKDIAAIAAQLTEKTSRRPLAPEKILSLILRIIENSDQDPLESINTLYTQSISGLYDAFNDLALRNGLEMPEPAESDTPRKPETGESSV